MLIIRECFLGESQAAEHRQLVSCRKKNKTEKGIHGDEIGLKVLGHTQHFITVRKPLKSINQP